MRLLSTLIVLFASSFSMDDCFAEIKALPYGTRIVDPLIQSGIVVELELFAEMPHTSDTPPHARINELTALRDGSGRVFVNDQRGKLYEMSEGEAVLYMDFIKFVPELMHENGFGSGLESVAFHPDFSSNGKFYTGHVEGFDPSLVKGEVDESRKRIGSVGVLTEWTAKNPDAKQFEGSKRIMLRVALPTFVHGLQQIAFNPNAVRGGADYGMLYVCLGEAGLMQMSRTEDLRNLRSPMGCILRIDPLGTGSLIGDYGIPADNPWANDEDPKTLGEIWSMGMRNPHRVSWDTQGTGRMIFTDIGEMRVEEINIGEPGRDYGWPIREGVFRFNPAGVRFEVFELSEEELASEPEFTYPVAQYDHTQGLAISGGGVYRGKSLPELFGKYVFGDIVTGRLFYVEESELEFGNRAPVHEFHLSKDGASTSMARLLDGGRVDLRLGWDAEGELYFFEKGKGRIFKGVDSEIVNEPGSIRLGQSDRQLNKYSVEVDRNRAVVAPLANAMIDDMEDGDLFGLKQGGRGGIWIGKGGSPSERQEIEVVSVADAPGEGDMVLRLRGYGWSGSELSIPLLEVSEAGQPQHYDASVYDGIQYWIKVSDRERVRPLIGTVYTVPMERGGLCDGVDYQCDNQYRAKAGTKKEWTLIKVPFTVFSQEGFPNDGPLDTSIIKEIGLQIRGSDGLEILIDDIGFYKEGD